VSEQKSDTLNQAKTYAFLLLKFRQRSEKELIFRLAKKKFNPEVVRATLAFLKEKSFIDDRGFAKLWMESRLKKPYGLRRLVAELKIKGVDNKIIDERVSEIKDKYCEKDVVACLARERFEKLKGIDPVKAKRRVWAYLLRRGFSPEIVMDVIT
jgi:regulatory protein